eukprot:841667_1
MQQQSQVRQQQSQIMQLQSQIRQPQSQIMQQQSQIRQPQSQIRQQQSQIMQHQSQIMQQQSQVRQPQSQIMQPQSQVRQPQSTIIQPAPVDPKRLAEQKARKRREEEERMREEKARIELAKRRQKAESLASQAEKDRVKRKRELDARMRKRLEDAKRQKSRVRREFYASTGVTTVGARGTEGESSRARFLRLTQQESQKGKIRSIPTRYVPESARPTQTQAAGPSRLCKRPDRLHTAAGSRPQSKQHPSASSVLPDGAHTKRPREATESRARIQKKHKRLKQISSRPVATGKREDVRSSKRKNRKRVLESSESDDDDVMEISEPAKPKQTAALKRARRMSSQSTSSFELSVTPLPKKRKVDSNEVKSTDCEDDNMDSKSAMRRGAWLCRRVSIFWPMENSWFDGKLTKFDPEGEGDAGIYEITYDDEEVHNIDMNEWKHKLIPLKTAQKSEIRAPSLERDMPASNSCSQDSAQKPTDSAAIIDSDSDSITVSHQKSKKSTDLGSSNFQIPKRKVPSHRIDIKSPAKPKAVLVPDPSLSSSESEMSPVKPAKSVQLQSRPEGIISPEKVTQLVSQLSADKGSNQSEASSVVQQSVKPHNSSSEGSGQAAAEEPKSEGDDNAYEVEKIVGHQTGKDGQPLYKVRWKGWAPSYDQWCTEDELLGCHELVDDFYKREKEQTEKKVKRKAVKTVHSPRKSIEPTRRSMRVAVSTSIKESESKNEYESSEDEDDSLINLTKKKNKKKKKKSDSKKGGKPARSRRNCTQADSEILASLRAKGAKSVTPSGIMKDFHMGWSRAKRLWGVLNTKLYSPIKKAAQSHTFHVGETVDTEFEGWWYPAKVTGVEAGRVRIRYNKKSSDASSEVGRRDLGRGNDSVRGDLSRGDNVSEAASEYEWIELSAGRVVPFDKEDAEILRKRSPIKPQSVTEQSTSPQSSKPPEPSVSSTTPPTTVRQSTATPTANHHTSSDTTKQLPTHTTTQSMPLDTANQHIPTHSTKQSMPPDTQTEQSLPTPTVKQSMPPDTTNQPVLTPAIKATSSNPHTKQHCLTSTVAAEQSMPSDSHATQPAPTPTAKASLIDPQVSLPPSKPPRELPSTPPPIILSKPRDTPPTLKISDTHTDALLITPSNSHQDAILRQSDSDMTSKSVIIPEIVENSSQSMPSSSTEYSSTNECVPLIINSPVSLSRCEVSKRSELQIKTVISSRSIPSDQVASAKSDVSVSEVDSERFEIAIDNALSEFCTKQEVVSPPRIPKSGEADSPKLSVNDESISTQGSHSRPEIVHDSAGVCSPDVPKSKLSPLDECVSSPGALQFSINKSTDTTNASNSSVDLNHAYVVKSSVDSQCVPHSSVSSNHVVKSAVVSHGVLHSSVDANGVVKSPTSVLESGIHVPAVSSQLDNSGTSLAPIKLECPVLNIKPERSAVHTINPELPVVPESKSDC